MDPSTSVTSGLQLTTKAPFGTDASMSLANRNDIDANEIAANIVASANSPLRNGTTPFTLATISSGFEKGDFLVREEKGQRVYFDFFEEAFNYIAYKGYIRMPKDDEKEWMSIMGDIHASVKGGMKYNTGKLLMCLYRPLEEFDMGRDPKDVK